MKHFLKLCIHSFNFVCMCACECTWLSRVVMKAPECACLPMTRFRKMCLTLKSTVNIGNHNKKWFREADCLGLRVSSLGKQAGDPGLIISTQNWTHKQDPYSWYWCYMAVLILVWRVCTWITAEVFTAYNILSKTYRERVKVDMS